MMESKFFNINFLVSCVAGTIPSRSAPVDW
jgi:hypothetical protein